MNIIEHYGTGISVEAVASERDLEVHQVLEILLDNNVVIRRMRSVAWVDDNSIRCSKCNQIKGKEGFPRSSDRTRPEGYYLSYCKSCRKVQLAEKNLERKKVAPLRDKFNRARLRATTLNLDCDIDEEYLEFLWNRQKGLCVYTGEVMELAGARTGRNTLAASIDRVDNSLGYIKGNVVFCSNRANSIKTDLTLQEFEEWMPTWYQKSSDLLASLNNTKETK